jgi:hypothetical protein
VRLLHSAKSPNARPGLAQEHHGGHFDDTLWLRRAHSVGNRRQLLNMITYALGVNALSMHVRRQGLAPPQAA